MNELSRTQWENIIFHYGMKNSICDVSRVSQTHAFKQTTFSFEFWMEMFEILDLKIPWLGRSKQFVMKNNEIVTF